jgi:type I restriction-modification system DNA methylase subunit
MPTSVAEKKKYGEVFTPFNTVRKILDQLPIEVWNNPDLKWLDPCCGIGQFPVIIVQRLMEGLKEWEEDEEKRYKHIIENMLYVGELNPKNMWIFNNLFDRMQERKLKINFYRGDFLKDDFDKKIKETISTSPSNISRESPSSVRFIFPWFSIVVISS